MRKVNRIAVLAALLAGLTPASALAVTPSAAQTGTVTITNPTAGTYNIYQLFTGNFTESATTVDGQTVNVPDVSVPSGLQDGSVSAATDSSKNQMGNIAFGASAGENGEDLIKAINDYVNTLETKPDNWPAAGFAPDDSGGSSAAYKTAKLIADTPALQTTAFTNYLASQLKTTVGTVDATKGEASITTGSLDSGYYLITSTPTSESAATSAIMMPVAGTLTIANKSTTPTLDKQIKDATTLASADGAARWDADFGDSAAVQISGADTKTDDQQTLENENLNSASYQLTGTVAHNIIDYKTYGYTFTDTMPSGVVTDADNFAQWNVQVTYSGLDASGKEVSSTQALADSGFEATFAPLKDGDADAIPATTVVTLNNPNLIATLEKAGIDCSYAHSNDIKVTVTYTPVYNEASLKAIYATASSLQTPQTNSATLTFPNSPYETTEAPTTSTTPPDQTRLYSYNLTLNKIQPAGDDATKSNPLSGAKFVLLDPDGNMVGNEIVADDNGTFTFSGLADDTVYTIKETQTPDGFKNIDPIQFYLTSTVDKTTGEVTAITATVVSDPSGALSKDADGNPTFTVTDATAQTNVLNVPGPSMPLTGENQMTIGVIAGAAIIGISAYFYTRKKKEAE